MLPEEERPTNTASGSNEEDDENAGFNKNTEKTKLYHSNLALICNRSPDVDDCHVIVNDKSTEFMLATVVEEAGK